MVRVRPKVIVDAKYESQTSYTINLDLPTSGKLSTLFLKVAAKTATTGNCPSPWMKYLISSVSVNQGGQAHLNSAPPELFQADYYYKTGMMPQFGYQRPGGDGAIVDEVIPIMFGDLINDPNYYIDLSKLADPQLSITYNLAETDHSAQTVWNTAYYPRFTVLTNLFQGAGLPAPKGYQSLRTTESWDPANSEKRKIELKGTRPIKRLYIQHDTLDADEELLHIVDTFKIWGDNEAWIPFELDAWPYTELIRHIYGICTAEAYIAYAKGGQQIDMMIDRLIGGSVHLPLSATEVAKLKGAAGRMAELESITMSSGSATTTVNQVEYNFQGLMPWSVGPIDMPKMLGIDTLDPQEHAPVFLQLDHVSNAGDYSSKMKVHTQDIVRQA